MNLEPRFKIVDEEGNVIEDGFRTKQATINMIRSLKLNKQDRLEVVEI